MLIPNIRASASMIGGDLPFSGRECFEEEQRPSGME
jgi:hypothetical protein